MADVDYFLTVPGVTGSSTDEDHPGAIRATGFSWGTSTTTGPHLSTGSGTGRAKAEPLVVTASSSIASPELFIRCARGVHLAEVTFVARKAGAHPIDVLTLTLKDALITSYRQAGQEVGQPADTVELTYRSMTQTYVGQKPDGSSAPPVTDTFDFGSAH
jgi:type VI secretion system secreted protein Hcp